MTKKQRALEIIERLKKEYPDAGCTLDYDQAWKLLVSVRLAAQCTDARVNIVVEKLYEKFPDVDALADAPVEEIEAIVKPCGLGHSKARDISACMKILRNKAANCYFTLYNSKIHDISSKVKSNSFNLYLNMLQLSRDEADNVFAAFKDNLSLTTRDKTNGHFINGVL